MIRLSVVMSLRISHCPVPSEQRPINEYKDLSTSWFYRWAALEGNAYLKPIAWIVGLSGLVVAPVAAASFPPAKYPTQFVLSGIAGASFFLGLVLIWLYCSWIYVRDRLTQATVPYEESGWYDGQLWEKPTEDVTRDRLIVTYEIQPILTRLQRTFAILGVILVGSVLCCVIL